MTPSATDATCFHAALGAADMLCLMHGRIQFLDADRNECALKKGQAFLYFGNYREAFALAFAPIGAVLLAAC